MAYTARAADRRLDELVGGFPAVLVLGPRAVGKTTTAQRHVRTVVRLDREAEAVAFRADPDAALRGLQEPVLLDEWQETPGVLGAVKRSVDEDPRPGRFILTGSVRADLDTATWPGTGRLVRLTMWGLTARERFGDPQAPSLFDRLRSDGIDAFHRSRATLDLRDYVEMALTGGFPEPSLRLSPATRGTWLDSYVEQVVTRDALHIEAGRDPERLRRFFEAFAANTSGVVEDRTIYEAAGLNRKTAEAYEQLLKNLLMIDWLPAWSSNRLKRLVRSPKRHLTDPALLAPLLLVDAAEVLREGDLLGRTLESFVVAQLRAELALGTQPIRMYHLRTREGRQEIDVLAETTRGMVAMEVKADAAPSAAAAKHLGWLRDELGSRFQAGVVLHTGPNTYELGDRIIAAPISALWTS